MKTLAVNLVAAITGLMASAVCAQDDLPLTRLFDTVAASADVLAVKALAQRTGWREVAEDDVGHRFSGDAVLLNDKLVLVLRQQGHGPEVYAKTAGGLKARATLGQAATVSAGLAALGGFKVIENSSGAVMVEAGFKSASPGGLRFRLTAGESLVEIQSGEAGGFVDVRTLTRYVVVPDYFGDDLVYGREDFHGASLPAENFCLSLIDGGDAVVMSVWQSADQDAWLAQPTSGADAKHYAHRIRCLKDKRIWLAFIESPGIWHAADNADGAGWTPPFPAKWRTSLVQANGLAASWDLERGPGAGRHEGPRVSYPLDRSAATPLTATCPTDVMRNTLGVGPCQYILACESLAAEGDPTPNSVMGWVEKQFEQKRERKAADDIQERLEQMTRHVADARSRIERYAAFAGRVRKLLPEQAGVYHLVVEELARFAAEGLTPSSSPARARELAGQIAPLIGKGDGLAQCQSVGGELRSIGAAQDHTLAKCRMAVRRLRQQSKTALATTQPAGAELAQEIGRLAEDLLRNK
jgi:hypothetical protein